jgi:SAM-dependent methyltransferase
MERIVEQEWMDDDCAPQEIEMALRSIGYVNCRFGGDRLHARLLACALARAPRARRPHILEVASGQGEVLRTALCRLQIAADVTLLDRRALHLPNPQSWPPELTPRVVTGDALDLPFPDGSVDVISCCLFLHHLEPPEIMRFLAEAMRVARIALVINDLERTCIHYRLAQLYSLSDRGRLSAHDGPVSVRRSYTYRELARVLENTGRPFSLERAYLFRLGAIVWADS